ncbi:MAG: protein kinase domain-containing protein [Aridibacter sp.]
MKQAQWEKVNVIMEKVIAIEPLERREFLKNSDVEAEILAEVESLLAFEKEAENFMSLPARDFSDGLFLQEEIEQTSLIGLKIGVYEITEELGFGGMGAVYLAKRIDEKFEQKVAIKMLRREFNIEEIRQRFKVEREIQAALVHPNIATLLDAGTTAEGVPYLVMEYVEGIRIDKFCLENNLKLNERLKLFSKVCEAVSFAHRSLVIHRDIKPSNIIVTKKGEPKLLDFGISKLIINDGNITKTITKLGAMTPEYASPEQVKGESVTTATDIYSLGVVLFKLLTGTMPYDTENKSDAKVFSEITNSKAKIPSKAALENSKFKIQNSKLLKGGLDNIILKSLRKEPERRYKTVEQFAADIWRFIDGLPVSARPSTFSYRASKFYGRNKIQVLAGVLVILSLITGIAVAVWQAKAAREQAFIAAESQKKAEIEAAHSKAEEERAKKITAFMEKIISYANPNPYAKGYESNGEAKVIDVLNEMSDKIETDFPSQPDIQAELHHKFAEVYTIRINPNFKIRSAAEIEKAKYHSQRAIELRKKFYGENHELVAKDMYYLWAVERHSGKDYAGNPQLLAEAIQMMRETNPKNPNLPYMLLDYAIPLYSNTESMEVHESYYKNAIPKPAVGRLELAENYQTEALTLFRAALPENHSSIITCKCDLAKIQIEQKKFGEAQKNFQFCIQFKNLERSEKYTKEVDEYAVRLEKGLNK